MTKVWPGNDYPLGATYDGAGTNFSIFSEIAERVELCLFDEKGNETRFDLPEITSSSDGLPRERSGRDFPASVPEQLSVGLGAFRWRNPKHRVSAISRDRIANARDGALWIFSSLQRANSLAQQLPNQDHTAIRGSQVF